MNVECALVSYLGASPLCPCPTELSRLTRGLGGGFPREDRLLVSPAEAVTGSHQGLGRKNNTQCRDGETKAACGLVQDPVVRQQCVELKLSDTDLQKSPGSSSRWKDGTREGPRDGAESDSAHRH